MQQKLCDDIEQMKIALQEAIVDAQSAETIPYGGFDGQLLSRNGGSYTYQDIDENAKIVVIDAVSQEQRKLKVDARVLSREASTLLIVTRIPLPTDLLGHLFLVEDKTWLLKRQLHALSTFAETNAEFGAKTLGLLPVVSGTKTVRGKIGTFSPHPHQKQAIAHGLASEKTLIIGPPGTGKTLTLSDLICRYLRQGLSVLLVSHTNIATDNAFIRLVQTIRESKKADLQTLVDEGFVVRAGDPRRVALRSGSYRSLTVNALAEARMGKQTTIREQLEASRSEIGRRIERLEQELREHKERWQPERDRLRQEIEEQEQALTSARTHQAESEAKDRAFLQKRAQIRAEAQPELERLQAEELRLKEHRSVLLQEQKRAELSGNAATQELQEVQAMSWLQRKLSKWRTYDEHAQVRRIEDYRQAWERATPQIKEAEEALHINYLQQGAPRVRIGRAHDEERWHQQLKKNSPSRYLADIERIERQLLPLRERVEQGEAPLAQVRAAIDVERVARTKIETRLADLRTEQEGLKAQIVSDAQLVATTTTSVYLNLHLLEREFDVVVVDELSMISVISVLLVGSRATKHMVGAGDPMQLSPVVKLEHEEKAPHAKEWLGKDLFTYLGISIFDAIRGEKECCLLTHQGRSSPSIIAPINHFVYQDMLTSREETEKVPGIEPHPEWPLSLVDTTKTEARCIKPGKHRPRENDYHAYLAVLLAQQALESLPPRLPTDDPTMPRLAIIAPYRSQVQLIQKKLREAKIAHQVHVGTINTVQGMEFPVVIFDTVEAPGLPPWKFTFDATLDERQMATEATRRLTVAWTRARYKLIVIAHREHLRVHRPRHQEEDPAGKQRLLVDLVDWAYEQGHVNVTDVLGLSASC